MKPSMMMTRRDFLQTLAAVMTVTVLPLKAEGSAGQAVPVLLYHDIDAVKEDEYTILAAAFAAQMEWLYSHGYQAISLQDLDEGRIPDRPVVITFDDGYASFLVYALPLMEQYGFKTTLTIIGRYVGAYYTIGMNRPMMSWDECRYLARTGLVSLGCHTYHLHNFEKGGVKGVTEEAFYRDLMSFQETMTQELGKPTDIMAWPFGLYHKRHMEVAEKAGFKYLLTSIPETYRMGQSLREIPRIAVGGGVDLKVFKMLIGAAS
jgi:peptidoglycan/xylan/chitin deacetylase (PgdA/CDA1 family)